MSHYAVAVIHREDQDIDEMLAPYNENIQVAPYIAMTRREAIDYARKNYKSAEGKTDQECWKMVADSYDNKTDKDGNIYSTYNPQSKWDWYEIGGRFYDSLSDKDGNVGPEMLISECDCEPDKEAYERALKYWDVVVEHKEPEEGSRSEYFSIYNEQYYRDRYKDRETFAKCSAAFSFYAVVTPDGIWHAPGNMGWFAMSDESDEDGVNWDLNFKKDYIDTADPSMLITIVDCHI